LAFPCNSKWSEIGKTSKRVPKIQYNWECSFFFSVSGSFSTKCEGSIKLLLSLAQLALESYEILNSIAISIVLLFSLVA